MGKVSSKRSEPGQMSQILKEREGSRINMSRQEGRSLAKSWVRRDL